MRFTDQKAGSYTLSLAPLAVQSMKQVLRQATTDQVDEDFARSLAEQCLRSNDLQEGLQAKSEKRVPRFEGS